MDLNTTFCQQLSVGYFLSLNGHLIIDSNRSTADWVQEMTIDHSREAIRMIYASTFNKINIYMGAFAVVFVVYRFLARYAGIEVMVMMLICAAYGFLSLAVAAIVSQRRRRELASGITAQNIPESIFAIRIWNMLWRPALCLCFATTLAAAYEAESAKQIYKISRPHSAWLRYCHDVQPGKGDLIATYTCQCGPECNDGSHQEHFLQRFERDVCADEPLSETLASGNIDFLIVDPSKDNLKRVEANKNFCARLSNGQLN